MRGLFAAIAANTPCVAAYAAHTAAGPPRYWLGQYARGLEIMICEDTYELRLTKIIYSSAFNRSEF